MIAAAALDGIRVLDLSFPKIPSGLDRIPE